MDEECLTCMACLKRDSQGVMVEMELKKRLYSLRIKEDEKVVGVHSAVRPEYRFVEPWDDGDG